MGQPCSGHTYSLSVTQVAFTSTSEAGLGRPGAVGGIMSVKYLMAGQENFKYKGCESGGMCAATGIRTTAQGAGIEDRAGR